jgi:hypothetical protein
MQNPAILKPGKRPYYKKIIRMFGSSLIAYWPLWESNGSVATDISGNARPGAYTGVDFGYPGIGDGKRSPYFDGANDYALIYSASLASAFNGAEGSILMWLKMFDATIWTDGLNHEFIRLYADDNNRFEARKHASAAILRIDYTAGGTLLTCNTPAQTSVAWFPVAITWSKAADEYKCFLNGSQFDTTKNGLGTWAGSLTNISKIGAQSDTPTSVWNGWISHTLLLNRAATPAEISKASRLI